MLGDGNTCEYSCAERLLDARAYPSNEPHVLGDAGVFNGMAVRREGISIAQTADRPKEQGAIRLRSTDLKRVGRRVR